MHGQKKPRAHYQADFIVIASNTVHLCVAEVERRVPRLPPVLHIADCVAASWQLAYAKSTHE